MITGAKVYFHDTFYLRRLNQKNCYGPAKNTETIAKVKFKEKCISLYGKPNAFTLKSLKKANKLRIE